MTGILYGVGVGPGDPEYMTLKAVRLIRENEVIAVPGTSARESVACRIAMRAVPELADKTLLALHMPMTHDREELERNHDQAADEIAAWLDRGENVVFLTLGDPTVYSTYSYVQKRIEARGYRTETVSGIPSFCAAAAAAGIALAEWGQQIHVLPAVHRSGDALELPGTYVLMKAGRQMKQVKEMLEKSGRGVVMVENCGMPEEHICRSVREIPDDAGYYSLIIAKEAER